MTDQLNQKPCCGGACKCRTVATTNVIAFEVPGLPVPKARARVTRAGITYTPRETLNYEAQVRVAYAGAYPRREPFPAGTALWLRIEAHFPLPASAPKHLRRHLETGATTPMTQRPDLDNLVKTVLDALNRVAWADDGQVAEITARKRRTVRAPRLTVWVAELVAPVTGKDAGTDAKAALAPAAGAGRVRINLREVFSRQSGRSATAGAPAEAAVGADAACPPSALGPPSSRSPNTPTGNNPTPR